VVRKSDGATLRDYSATFIDMGVKNKEVFVLCEKGKEHMVTAEATTSKGKKLAKTEELEMKESEEKISPKSIKESEN